MTHTPLTGEEAKRFLREDIFAPLEEDNDFEYTETDRFKVTDWQLKDLTHLYGRPWSANFSEMGCYKTSTTLWLVQHKLANIRTPRVLIITTKSGKGTYLQAAPHILPSWVIYSVTTNDFIRIFDDKEFRIPPDQQFNGAAQLPSVVLAHYQVFNNKSKMLAKMLATPWDFVILDEAHRIKGQKTQWTKNIKKLKTPYRHIMTGTGFINRPDELWSLLNFLNRREFGSYWQFRREFCEESSWDGYAKVTGLRLDKVPKFRRMIRTIGVKRTKNEVFKNLPEPIKTPIEIQLNATQRKMYDDIKTYLHTLDQAGEPIHSPNVLSMLNRLRQICVATPEVVSDEYDEKLERRVIKVKLVEPSSKLDALMEIIEGLEWDEERKDQVVVFSCFRDPVELAKKRFDKAGISYIHLQQSDNDRERYNKWAIEFPKKEHQVFISTLQLGSESISLTPATTCVFLDRSWSPKDNEQGISRVWRPGQEHVANIINIDAVNTVDRRILKANEQKMGWFRTIFGEEEE